MVSYIPRLFCPTKQPLISIEQGAYVGTTIGPDDVEKMTFPWPQMDPDSSVFQPVAQYDSDIFKRCLEPTRYKVTGN
jgi:hypothetical protein